MKKNRILSQDSGFTLIETLVVIAIIGILASFALVSLLGARSRAFDVRRKVEISQIGKFLTQGCYLPEIEESEYGYDLVPLSEELGDKSPQYKKYLSNIPKDPTSGTETESMYFYIVNDEGTECALYANLQNSKESITLPDISEPTSGGGKGVFEWPGGPAWNGTDLYFQYSN